MDMSKLIPAADSVPHSSGTIGEMQEATGVFYTPFDKGYATMAECDTAMYNYVKSLNGCYNEKGVKIHEVLDGRAKKLAKTGKYDIIVGGKTAKRDQGTVKFVAPKAGTYRFSFSVKNNVTGNNVCIKADDGFDKLNTKYYQTVDGEDVRIKNVSTLVLLAVNDRSYEPATGTVWDRQPGYWSEMEMITGTVKLK